MKIKDIPFVLLLALLVTSCNDNPDPTKDETTTVNGTVVEYGTNKPLGGAIVKMINTEKGRTVVAETSTDANGTFYYNYKGPTSFGLCSYVYKDQYFTEEGSYSPDNPEMCHQWGVDNYLVITTKPYAWLKLRLINISGAYEIHINSLIGGTQSFTVRNSADTTIISRVWGNYIASIPIFIDSSIVTRRDSVFCPGHDTTYYEIEY